MAQKDFYAKQGDTGRPLSGTLSGTASLAGATVTASMDVLNPDGTYGSNKFSGQACVVDDATNRKVHYDWGASDLNTVGNFAFEFKVVYSGGRIERHPNRDDSKLVVHVATKVA